jgi:hypothetical protein
MTLQHIKDLYKRTFYLSEGDDILIDLLCAIALGVHTKSDPIWLLIIGASSSGKSEFVNTLGGMDYSWQVSNLTDNTFLSGMGGSDGQEKSLLHKMGENALLLMKDYTSILSMKDDKKTVILGQMREIFDKYITKKTGNGRDVEWRGKINFVGACTDSIYFGDSEDASMGYRTINYIMPVADRKIRIKKAKRASQNLSDMEDKREAIKTAFTTFLTEKKIKLDTILPALPEELVDELIPIADFSSQMRTATRRNYRGELELVPSFDEPMRMSQQILLLAQLFIYINDGVLKEEHRRALVKVALDSIPKTRRMTLKILATYRRITKKGLAQMLGYPTDTVGVWLEDLNVIGGCTRVNEGSGADLWAIAPEFRKIMIGFDQITELDIDLVGTEGEGYYPSGSYPEAMDDKGAIKDSNDRATQRFDMY